MHSPEFSARHIAYIFGTNCETRLKKPDTVESRQNDLDETFKKRPQKLAIGYCSGNVIVY